MMHPHLPKTPYAAPIFSFKAMSFPKSSLDYPFTYAKRLIKLQLALESRNGTDLHASKHTTKLPLKELEGKLENHAVDIKANHFSLRNNLKTLIQCCHHNNMARLPSYSALQKNS